MYACITRETFVFTIFRRVFHSILKLELCRHAYVDVEMKLYRHIDMEKNMPTTALLYTERGLFCFVSNVISPQDVLMCG